MWRLNLILIGKDAMALVNEMIDRPYVVNQRVSYGKTNSIHYLVTAEGDLFE